MNNPVYMLMSFC